MQKILYSPPAFFMPFYSKISVKIILSFLLASLLPLILGGYQIFANISGILITASLKNIQNNVYLHSLELDPMSDKFKKDLVMLTDNHALKALINAKKGEENYENSRKMAEDFFVDMFHAEKSYMQIRYIDEHGLETVRVDSDGEKSRIMAEEKLQNKKEKPYFTETMKLPNGSLYISPLELNREGSPPQIEIPYKPVLRYAAPVFNEKNQRRGIVITNIFADSFLEHLEHALDKSFPVILTDKTGFYFSHTDKAKKWGGPGNLNTGEGLYRDFPDLAPQILSGEASTIADKINVYSYMPIFPDKNHKENYWVFLTIIPKENASPLFSSMRNTFLLFGLLIIGAVFLLAYLISNSISNPIKYLSLITKKISEGDLSQKAEIKSLDELGQLANSFNIMTYKLKSLYSSMENKVKEKTKELENTLNEVATKNSYLETSRIATLNILEDIEIEKEKATREKEKNDTILQSIGDGVFVLDNDLKIIVFNQIASKISGYKREEAIGKKYNQILHFVSADGKKNNDHFIKECISTGKIIMMEKHTILVTKNDRKIPVADSAAPLKDKNGQVMGCVVVFRDVTKEREVDLAKSEFVSLASHQLRTPLSSINWYAEMLLNGDAGKLNEDQKSFVDEIYHGNQRMVELVNSLLNISRLELGTFMIEPIMTDLTTIAVSVLAELNADVSSKQLQIEKIYQRNLPQILADPKLVRIIFQNLLSNAVKYTPVKGKIKLTIKTQDRDILIQVKDTGCGIPQAQQSKIFTKLFRADNARQMETDGTGLGLYIVKSILDKSGGNIIFRSEENKGTTITARIPIAGMKKKKGNKELS